MEEITFKKKRNGVVINTNKAGLRKARNRKKELLLKEERIEKRLDSLEEQIRELKDLIINKVL